MDLSRGPRLLHRLPSARLRCASARVDPRILAPFLARRLSIEGAQATLSTLPLSHTTEGATPKEQRTLEELTDRKEKGKRDGGPSSARPPSALPLPPLFLLTSSQVSSYFFIHLLSDIRRGLSLCPFSATFFILSSLNILTRPLKTSPRHMGQCTR